MAGDDGPKVVYSTHHVSVEIPKRWLDDPVPADIWGSVTAVCNGLAAVRFRMYGEDMGDDGAASSVRIGIVNKSVNAMRIRFVSFDIVEEALNLWDSFTSSEVEEVEGGAELSLSCPAGHDLFNCLIRHQGRILHFSITLGVEID